MQTDSGPGAAGFSFETEVLTFSMIGLAALALVQLLIAVVCLLSAVCQCSSRLPRIFRTMATMTPLTLALFYGITTRIVPELVDNLVNGVHPEAHYNASVLTDPLRAFHRSLLIVDMHADPLMWTYRDYMHRSSTGHTDYPRLIEGNIGIQGFATVTKAPLRMTFDNNRNTSDTILLTGFAQQWPWQALWSLYQRASLQAARLQALIDESDGRIHLITTTAKLDAFVELKAREPSKHVGAFLAVEGAHMLEGDLDNLDRIFALGFRMLGPTHFFDNELGGSAHGVGKHGLTPFGRAVIARMEQLGMVVDVAHASPRVVTDILAMATRPVVASHAGVQGTCNNTRTLTDAQLDGIRQTNGVVGISFFQYATCGRDIASIVRAIRYTVDRIGVAHVGIGADFDGAVKTPIDASQMAHLTAALRDQGRFSDDDIRLIMGLNVVRVLREVLPQQ